jgi:hypothetical protein
MSVEAELRRRDTSGQVVDYVLVDDPDNAATLLSDPTVDFGTRARLDAIAADIAALEMTVGTAADAETLNTLIGRLKRLVTLLSGTLTVQVQNLPVEHYLHFQSVPAATWDITHNLGFYPNATIVDSAGQQVEGDIDYISPSRLQVVFPAAFAGSAFLS